MDETMKPTNETAVSQVAHQPDRTDELQGASHRRQADRRAEEDRRTAQKEMILAAINKAQMPSVNAHWLWTAISTSGITPRPDTAEQFATLLWELVRENRIRLVQGSPQSAPTKLIVAKVEQTHL
jgi:hypothetical protein